MRRYRCWHDVIESVLEALLTGKKSITELCLYANVPVDRGKRLINYLISCGLVFRYEENGRIYYKITERGYEWVRLFIRFLYELSSVHLFPPLSVWFHPSLGRRSPPTHGDGTSAQNNALNKNINITHQEQHQIKNISKHINITTARDLSKVKRAPSFITLGVRYSGS